MKILNNCFVILKLLLLLGESISTAVIPNNENTSEAIIKLENHLKETPITDEKLFQLSVLAVFTFSSNVFDSFATKKVIHYIRDKFKISDTITKYLEKGGDRKKFLTDKLLELLKEVKQSLNECKNNDINVLYQIVNELLFVINDNEHTYSKNAQAVNEEISKNLDKIETRFLKLWFYNFLFDHEKKPKFNEVGFNILKDNFNKLKKKNEILFELEDTPLNLKPFNSIDNDILINLFFTDDKNDSTFVSTVLGKFKSLPDAIVKDDSLKNEIIKALKLSREQFYDKIRNMKVKELEKESRDKKKFETIIEQGIQTNLSKLNDPKETEELKKDILLQIRESLYNLAIESYNSSLYLHEANNMYLLLKKILDISENEIDILLNAKTIVELRFKIFEATRNKIEILYQEIKKYNETLDLKNDKLGRLRIRRKKSEKLSKALQKILGELLTSTNTKIKQQSDLISSQMNQLKQAVSKSIADSNVPEATENFIKKFLIN